jgi:hypothetical protein
LLPVTMFVAKLPWLLHGCCMHNVGCCIEQTAVSSAANFCCSVG